jgi:hypothetical protein
MKVAGGQVPVATRSGNWHLVTVFGRLRSALDPVCGLAGSYRQMEID